MYICQVSRCMAFREANIEATDANGFTPLMAASQKGFVECVYSSVFLYE